MFLPNVDLFYQITLVLFLAIVVYFRAYRVRLLGGANMADTARPQTPTSKKVFKPSNKTKTPTKLSSNTATPQSSQSVKPLGDSAASAPRKLFPKRSATSAAESTRPIFSDINKKTVLTPLPSGAKVRKRVAGSVASDTTHTTIDTSMPIGLIDNELLTPTDTYSRSTDALRDHSRKSSLIMTAATGFTGQDENRSDVLSEPTETATHATASLTDKVSQQDSTLDQASKVSGATNDFASKPTGAARDLQGNVTSHEGSLTAKPAEQHQPTDFAKYFEEQGNPEMSEFVKALTASAPPDEALAASGIVNGAMGFMKDAAKGMTEKVTRTTDGYPSAPDPINELHKDDGPINNTTSKVEITAGDATPKASDQKSSGENNSDRTTPKVDWVKNTASGGTGSVTKDEHGNTNVGVDNAGKPAQINRRVEIPLPRPQPPTHSNLKIDNSGPGLRGVPGLDTLPSTNDLPNVDGQDDPPEEFLDPNIHSPQFASANISPIPKVAKIAPIGSVPPPDLFRLANGLGGKTVDDVGNIIDETGKVVGHATGDLPAMIGKKVADNGEIYGESGELIGYVTENLTGHPPPEQHPAHAMPLPGGLTVDAEGNIFDSSGKAIGKLNNKPAQSGLLVSHSKPTQDAPKTEEKPEHDQEKEKENQGIPADIFLDVKSTPDGIQLTIRIPTVFKQEPRKPQEPQEASS